MFHSGAALAILDRVHPGATVDDVRSDWVERAAMDTVALLEGVVATVAVDRVVAAAGHDQVVCIVPMRTSSCVVPNRFSTPAPIVSPSPVVRATAATIAATTPSRSASRLITTPSPEFARPRQDHIKDAFISRERHHCGRGTATSAIRQGHTGP